MQAKSSLPNSLPNGQESPPQLKTLPCERCGEPVPYKTQYGVLCEPCYEQAGEQAVAMYAESDNALCQIVASNSGKDGDKVLAHLAALELARRRDLQLAIDALGPVRRG